MKYIGSVLLIKTHIKNGVKYISDYNASHDKPFNEATIETDKKWTVKASAYGLLLCGSAGLTTSISLPKN